ncbi:helix-turn-helix domain-containing protein [Solidesulfovibrio sp.]|uniref:winged helix-turn-helix transcriptional regulator n=1 Tax=Solidesulfovibrio sp. TaxID=2910990 RepID=UPI00261A4EBC|nr:helix-turn-helix domain-containing protein [Solidesulfovibrio sp.]
MELAIIMIGGKWKPLILWALGANGMMRFGELRRLLSGASQKMLTQQLRELETDGLIVREAHPQVPPRVEYSLTTRALRLVPILNQLDVWAQAVEQEKSEAHASSIEDASPSNP